MKEKSYADRLREELAYNPKHGSAALKEDEIRRADEFCEDYKDFLNNAKTEREAVAEAVKLAEIAGFVPFEKGKVYTAGQKVYCVNRGKAVMLAVIGSRPIREGVRLAIAHIDSPRLDLKPNPLFESDELAMLKTHYYGGLKKYQWTTIPLAMHGVIMLKNGEKLEVRVGEEEGDPQFCITDILPHLGAEQAKKTLSTAIPAENLNILVGSRAIEGDKGTDLVKLNVLRLLNETYGMIETDFLTAEIEFVPAAKARDVGFDRSMIGAYGHDDRVCAYPALMAALTCNNPTHTAVTVLTDKEEIGSEGNTGLQSAYMKYFLYDLAEMQGAKGRDVLSASQCLSADVNAAYDPIYADAYEKRNSCYLNKGVCITKYTGARGKSGTSDASAEYMSRVRSLLDSKNVLWQIGELGKVDVGGGGTVAKFVANLDVDTVDMGVPVLSMHAPWEIVSKIDVYMAYRAFFEFFLD